MKAGLAIILGIILLLCLCLCCCCMSILFMSRDASFRKEYCSAYFDNGGVLRNEPTGWCAR